MKIDVSWSPNPFGKVIQLTMHPWFPTVSGHKSERIIMIFLWFIPRAITQHHSEQQKQNDVTSVLQVRLTFLFKRVFTQFNMQEDLRELLCLVFSFSACYPCWLGHAPVCPQRLAPSQVTTRLSLQLGAIASAGCISITSKKKKEKRKRLWRSRAKLSTSTTPSGCCQDQQLTQLLQYSDQCFKETLVHLCCMVFLERPSIGWWCCCWNISLC